ncbi:hypothetical protein SDC9_140345 [bioreactor metagenome]|uniref:4Fe-4S ferredoxin-type domain-containing protein n=1 Tax=bioreactor metagenome TaxID=1076179 RepID=A0A645DV81_9ZZZZ
MVLYFSGTGNSRLAARIVAKATGDELVSINDRLKQGDKTALHSEHPFVFVAPVYAWQLPRVVADWIRQTSFTGNRDAYFVVTMGSSCAGAGHFAQTLCQEKGLTFRGLAGVLMPENYVAMFPVPDKEAAEALLAEARPQLRRIGETIRDGASLPVTASLPQRLQSAAANPLFYRFAVGDKRFRVTEACISCGKCARRCPLNNVALEGGRPVWQGNCTHCMACICCCPVTAIEYGNRSVGKPRYDIMEDPSQEP